MTFAIPASLKTVNSLVTPNVLDIELNDTDIDRMMTHILELGVKRGRRAPSRTDTKAYADFLEKLQNHEELEGFDGEHGLAVLDGWVRASVLQFERGGRARAYAQMGYVRPLTIAAYRSGLPKTASRHRKADQLSYRSMDRVLRQRGAENPSAHIEDLFKRTFGRGVDLGQSPWADPRYNGDPSIDIDTLLALRFLEGFNGNVNPTKIPEEFDPPVPEAVDPLGSDLIDFLSLYGPALPVAEAYLHLSAMLSLRLFQLPLITARTVRALLSGDPAPSPSNPTETYCDFVRRRGSASDELSRQCVQRDLEILGTFFGDRLLLRSLADAAALFPELVPASSSASEKLRLLASIKSDPNVLVALGMKIQEIQAAMDENDQGREFIAELRASGLNHADQLKSLLVEGLRKRGLENQVKWFWSTGGISKPYGIMAGTQRARSTWRYAPSDECLTTLLCMCFVESSGTRSSKRLPMKVVLDRLRTRYGVLVDRPPADLDTADARSGAAENLVAFTRQLQLLGCFQGLSDDFSAQFVNRPREAVQ